MAGSLGRCHYARKKRRSIGNNNGRPVGHLIMPAWHYLAGMLFVFPGIFKTAKIQHRMWYIGIPLTNRFNETFARRLLRNEVLWWFPTLARSLPPPWFYTAPASHQNTSSTFAKPPYYPALKNDCSEGTNGMQTTGTASIRQLMVELWSLKNDPTGLSSRNTSIGGCQWAASSTNTTITCQQNA
jgi:hypothetical protein